MTTRTSLQTSIGVYRWDAYHGGEGTIYETARRCLNPARYHDKLPFFGIIHPDGTIDADDTDEPSKRAAEISYARNGGVDYWIFLRYIDLEPTHAPMEGVWQNADTTWTITPFDKSTGRYSLQTNMKDQPPGDFYATLGTIGTNRFVELTPQRPNAIHPKTFFGGHFIPLHSFWKVRLNGDNLTLTSMSTQWLEAMLKQNKININYEKPEGGMLFLTASTQELQDFVSKFADDPGAFPARGDEKGLAFVRSRETAK
jgi:hypothetical protein